ncbi:MMPL family transporter [Actinoplanes sp. NPDC051470]|uniref:MMPL family transporter n=1 Tax=Actinoplanes sp. NPDC051470 TaxID=3157224 RepID=UPI003417E245
MTTLLTRLGAWTCRRRRTVLLIWLAVTVAAGALAATAGGPYQDDFSIPGSRAQRTLDTVAERFPAASGASVRVVLVAPAGRRLTVEPSLAEARHAPLVAAVAAPIVSADGRTALVNVQYRVKSAQLERPALDALEDAFQPARDAGLRVEFGGSAYGEGESGGATEAAGLLIALLVLVITFGSLVAAGLPLLTALLGVGVTLAGLTAVAGTLALPTTAAPMALMLGLAVGIDYALFIVARHRSQLASGLPVAESVARAIGTAGAAVVFAGLTVVIALTGLTVVGIPFLSAMGLAAAAAVIVAVLVAVTLIPALLGLLGERLRPGRGTLPARRLGRGTRLARRLGRGTLPAQRLGRGSRPARRPMGAWWVRLVTRRPLVTTLIVVALLGVMAVPAADLRLALTDNGSAPVTSTQRQAYDLTAAAFGPGFNGPLLVLADLTREGAAGPAREGAAGPAREGAAGPARKGDADAGPAREGDAGQGREGDAAPVGRSDQAAKLAERLGAVDGVAAVGRPQLSTDGRYALVSVIPATGPQDVLTNQLVGKLEAAGWGSVGVTGATAIGIDISALLRAALVPFALIVVGLAFLLLAVAFRSLVVPLKATLGFLLSVGATLGAVVAVFQWGWLAELIGVPRTGPVISFMPIILMAVLFGLAMDYEVFLVSGMREEYVRSGDPRRAVTSGFQASARVVAAAALIMVAVFASFLPGGDATLKPIAFALAVGVLLDAFLIRMTLVPAVLTMAGHRAWWLPVMK